MGRENDTRGSRERLIESKVLERVRASGPSVISGGDSQRLREVVGERRAKLELDPGHRMLETKPRRVQEVSTGRQPQQPPAPAASIRVVANDRMANRCEMGAKLMRSSGVKVG